MNQLMLVTGGAGFIGSHLVEKLLDLGCRVRVLDNLSQGNREWVAAGAEFVEGDITDFKCCENVCRDVQAVFHLAAMSKSAPSLDKFEYCTEQNIIGTQNILMAARAAGVSKLIYSASSTYYGLNPPPHHEDQLPNCLNPYGLSKYVGELFCTMFTNLYGFPTICLRYFNVYGPRQPKVGTYALVLGIFLDQLKNEKPLTICGDGSQRRDFIHVKDVVDANLAALESKASGVSINIGSGSNVSIQDLANMISTKQVFLPVRKGDAYITLADISRAKELLNWKPKVSLAEGVNQLKGST